MARKMKTPVTVFLLGGILPLVPGRQIYQMVYYLIAQQNTLSANNLILTLNIAGAIALAIFLADTIFIMLKKEQPIQDVRIYRKSTRTEHDSLVLVLLSYRKHDFTL